jgi:hypothetical protein
VEVNPKLSDIFPLPNEAKRLQFFLGDWNAEGSLTFQGRPFKVKGLWKFTSAAAGWGILNIGKMDIEGLGAYEEVDILGFDPGEKMFHFFSVTNTGAARDHKGRWLDDNTISVFHEALQEGRTYTEEIEVKITSPREFTVHERDSLDSQVITTMDVTIRRQN